MYWVDLIIIITVTKKLNGILIVCNINNDSKCAKLYIK
jgi:hypothetical protein